jgi:glycosyltransferase involved in cell wall biosynthesis
MFVAPRLHSNQIDVLTALSRKHEVVMVTVGNDNLDQKSTINEIRLEPSIISRLCWKYGLFCKQPFRTTLFFPSFASWRKVYKFQHNKLVYRDTAPLAFIIYGIIVRVMRKSEMILYTQSPIFRVRSNSKLAKLKENVIGSVFDRWFSPVLYRGQYSIKNLVRRDNIHFVPFGTNLRTTESKRLKPSDTIKVISIGKFDERKNHKKNIEVIKSLRKSGIDITLSIIGQADNQERYSYLENLYNYIKDNHAEDYINIINNISRKEALAHFSDHHIFLLTSFRESASYSQLEAMSLGLPVIINSDNGTASYAETCGIVDDFTEHDRLFNAFIVCIDKYEEFSRRSVELVSERYNVTNYIDSFESILY